MKKLELFKKPGYQANLEAPEKLKEILPPLAEKISELQREAKLPLINFASIIPAKELVNQIREIVPNTDRHTQHFGGEDDPTEDKEKFDLALKERIYQKTGGVLSHAQVRTPKDVFYSFIDLPGQLLTDIVKEVKQLDAFLAALPDYQIFWQYLTLKDGEIAMKKGAEDAIKDQMTIWATEKQKEAYSALNELAMQAAKIQEDQRLPEGYLFQLLNEDLTINNQKISEL